jgi:hypothetical protein
MDLSNASHWQAKKLLKAMREPAAITRFVQQGRRPRFPPLTAPTSRKITISRSIDT